MADYVHEQDIGFLLWSRKLFQDSSLNMHVRDGSFKGLSMEGQSFLANMLRKRAVSYLLEKGALVDNMVCKNNSSVEFDVFSDIVLEFSEPIYWFLKSVYKGELKDANKYLGLKLKTGDAILFVFLSEIINEAYSNGNMDYDKYYGQIMNFLVQVSPVNFMCFKNTVFGSLSNMKLSMPKNMEDIFFALRYFIRDRMAIQLNYIFQQRDLDYFIKGLENFNKNFSVLYDARIKINHNKICKLNRIEIFAPFIWVIAEIFNNSSRVDEINKKLADENIMRSDRAKKIKELSPLFDWIRKLVNLHEIACRIQAYEDFYHEMQAYKKYFAEVKQPCRKNLQELMDFIENKI